MPKDKLFDEEEVLQKAMIVFWKKGYHDTSIQDLVDGLGINRASLYDTFGGKKILFYKAFELYRQINYDTLQGFLNTDKKIKETIKKVFRKIVTTDYADVDNKGCFIANSTTELIPGDAHLQVILKDHKRMMEKVFYDALLKAVKRGEISKDKNIKIISSLLYTLLIGLRVVGKTRPAKRESLASIDTIFSLLD